MVNCSENKLTEIVDFTITPEPSYLPCPKFQDNEKLSRRELARFAFNIVIYDANEQKLNGTYSFAGVVGSNITGDQWFSNDDFYLHFHSYSGSTCNIYENDNGAIGDLMFKNNNLHEKDNSWQEVNGNKIVNFKFYNDDYIYLLEHCKNSKVNGHYNRCGWEGADKQIPYTIRSEQ